MTSHRGFTTQMYIDEVNEMKNVYIYIVRVDIFSERQLKQ